MTMALGHDPRTKSGRLEAAYAPGYLTFTFSFSVLLLDSLSLPRTVLFEVEHLDPYQTLVSLSI